MSMREVKMVTPPKGSTSSSLSEAQVVQRLALLEEVLKSIVVVEVKKNTAILYDKVSQKWMVLDVKDGISTVAFHNEFPTAD